MITIRLFVFATLGAISSCCPRHETASQWERTQTFRSVRGIDGDGYSVELSWNELHEVPGSAEVMVRCTSSKHHTTVQHFNTGNRQGIKFAELLDHDDSPNYAPNYDVLAFQIQLYFGGRIWVDNVVDKTGLHGYPESLTTNRTDAVIVDGHTRTYIVGWNEDLAAISQMFNAPIPQLMAANHMVNPVLRPGRTLIVPRK